VRDRDVTHADSRRLRDGLRVRRAHAGRADAQRAPVAGDMLEPDQLRIAPALPLTRCLDAFGNVCTRLVAPAGELKISTDALIADSGLPDSAEPTAREHEIAELPHDTLVFLLGSRYCETERLMNAAWSRFGTTPPGWPRVQAICDFVHSHVRF